MEGLSPFKWELGTDIIKFDLKNSIKNGVRPHFIFRKMLIIILIVIGLIIFLWGWISSNLVLKIARLPLEITPATYGLPYENFQCITSDNIILKGWFIPYPGSHATIIVLHGWGANKGNVLPATYFLHQRGRYNVAYFDYRNHGESSGTFTSFGAYEKNDLIAVIDFLKQNQKEQCKYIGVLGVSLGGAIGILTASERTEISAVVAESAFANPKNVIARFAKLFYGIPRYPLMSITMMFAQLRSGVRYAKNAAVHCIQRIAPRPVFIIQCGRDVRMPLKEGESLFRAAGEPKMYWVVPDADHGEAYAKAPIEYEKKVLGFFNQYIPS